MKTVQTVSEIFSRFHNFIHVYIAQGQGQIAPKILTEATTHNSFTTLIIHYKFWSLLHVSIKKMIFQHILHTNIWGRKFDLATKTSKVNLQASFEQN